MVHGRSFCWPGFKNLQSALHSNTVLLQTYKDKRLKTYTMKNWYILYIFHTRALTGTSGKPDLNPICVKPQGLLYLLSGTIFNFQGIFVIALPVKMRTLNNVFKSTISANCAPCYVHCLSLLEASPSLIGGCTFLH